MSPSDVLMLWHPPSEQYPEGTYEHGVGAQDNDGRNGYVRVAIPDSVCDGWRGDVMRNAVFEYSRDAVALVVIDLGALRSPAGTVPLAN